MPENLLFGPKPLDVNEMKCKWRRSRWLYLFAVSVLIIIALAIIVGLYGGGIMNNQAYSTQAQLSMKQMWNAETDETAIRHRFVHSRYGTQIAWVSESFPADVHFAHFTANSLLYDIATLHCDTSIQQLALDDSDTWCVVLTVHASLRFFAYSITGSQSGGRRWQLTQTLDDLQQVCNFVFDTLSRLWIVTLAEVYGFRFDGKNWTKIHSTSLNIMTSNLFGQVIQMESHTLVVNDTNWENHKGCIHVFDVSSGQRQTITDESQEYPRFEFGQNFCLGIGGRQCVIAYNGNRERIELYTRGDEHSAFQHAQTIMQHMLFMTVGFTNFGYALSSNEKYVAISAPSEFEDEFSFIQIYHFQRDGRLSPHPQTISIDVSYLGRTIWLLPLSISARCTLIATNEKASAFGQLMVFQNAL